MHGRLLLVLPCIVAGLASTAYAATCNINESGLGRKRLGYFSSNWDLVDQTDHKNGTINIKPSSDFVRLGIRIPSTKDKEAGMILVKISDFGRVENGETNFPPNVRV